MAGEKNRSDVQILLRLGEREIRIGGAAIDTPYKLLAGGMEGFEASESVVETMEHALRDGSSVMSRRLSGRDLVITFEVADYADTERYKAELLSFFDPSADGVLTVLRTSPAGVVTERRIGCVLCGRVSMVQETLFSYLRVRVPLFCPDPYFVSGVRRVSFSVRAEPHLTFPLTVTKESGLTVGRWVPAETLVIENNGDAPTGFVFTLEGRDAAPGDPCILYHPYLRREEDGAYVGLLLGMTSGDRAELSTVPGDKYVRFNGERCMRFARESAFFSLLRGKNTLTLGARSIYGLPVASVSFYERYFGA
ncbi:MAG: phage tail family protein [Clostridia bacterium]|nr:phage tail family protein [Clostridia bacterium]